MYRPAVKSVTTLYFSVRSMSHSSISAAVSRRQCSVCRWIMRRSSEKPHRAKSSR